MQVNTTNLIHVLTVRQLTNVIFNQRPVPNAMLAQNRVVGVKGETYEVTGLADRRTIDELIAASNLNPVPFTDPKYGTFNVLLEVTEVDLVAGDDYPGV